MYTFNLGTLLKMVGLKGSKLVVSLPKATVELKSRCGRNDLVHGFRPMKPVPPQDS